MHPSSSRAALVAVFRVARLAALGLAVAMVSLAACSSEGVVGSLAKDPADASAGAIDPSDGGLTEPLAPSTTPLAAGGYSTCVKTSAGEERCWGDNTSGSLGLGDTSPGSSATPTSPVALGNVQSVAAGESAQCAISVLGKVYCWGDMFLGDFNGQPIDHLPSVVPSVIEGTTAVARVAVGRYFTCLLGPQGDVRCFGLNDKGQVGVGSTDKQYLPTTVTGFDGPVTSISASMGGLFVCATTQPGSVWCWGDNGAGQIAADKAPALSPRKVQALPERAVEVVAGGAHACARLVSGNVKCWGAGEAGQLGNGAKASSAVPVEVMYLTDVTALAAGLRHTCAVRREGTVFCWGDDTDGQAGGTPDPSRPLQVLAASFGGQFVSCGVAHTCAWGAGQVQCWGSNTSSQLGPRKASF
jgi:alpha-tubulin suppressor-like RCC1 family protein